MYIWGHHNREPEIGGSSRPPGSENTKWSLIRFFLIVVMVSKPNSNGRSNSPEIAHAVKNHPSSCCLDSICISKKGEKLLWDGMGWDGKGAGRCVCRGELFLDMGAPAGLDSTVFCFQNAFKSARQSDETVCVI